VNRTGRVWQVLSANAYAAYILHVPIVIGIQYALLTLPAGPLTKFAIVGLVSTPLTFGVSHLIRKLPRVKSIL
jgi:surface polysaccharide O-acyltransferase-like enzyme